MRRKRRRPKAKRKTHPSPATLKRVRRDALDRLRAYQALPHRPKTPHPSLRLRHLPRPAHKIQAPRSKKGTDLAVRGDPQAGAGLFRYPPHGSSHQPYQIPSPD